MKAPLNNLLSRQAELIECRRCPRLVAWREEVALKKVARHQDEPYWGRPVPDFGDLRATRLIVGLAPAAHGANRTGRIFTGDRSGEWLYRAMYRAGLCSDPSAYDANDGKVLYGVWITAVAHCAPPDNKPSNEEIDLCSDYLHHVLLHPWSKILCLGGLAWGQTLKAMRRQDSETGNPKFGHGVEYELRSGTRLIASYHPSQQNTFTGRLTEPMFDEVIARLKD